MGNGPGFSDVDDRLKRLSDLGDQLEALGGLLISRRFGLIWKWRLPIRAVLTAADHPTTR